MTWFGIAMDYLPIQASAVPSERIFSSSAQTDTCRRNSIKPILMESLQMLKFGVWRVILVICCIKQCTGLKKRRLDFTGGWVTAKSLMAEKEDVTEDLLGSFVGDDSDSLFDTLMEVLEDDEDEVDPV